MTMEKHSIADLLEGLDSIGKMIESLKEKASQIGIEIKSREKEEK